MGYFSNLASAFAGRKADMTSQSFAALLQQSFGSFGRVGTTYRSLVQEGFIRNVFAHRAIKDITMGASHVPLLVFRGDAEVPDHDLAKLLARPNFKQSAPRFILDLVSYYLLDGNAYARLVTGNDDNVGRPLQLFTLRPDLVDVTRERGTVNFTRYRFQGLERPFDVSISDMDEQSEIFHMKTFNPLDDLKGLSPLLSARTPIDRHNLAEEWNSSLIRNFAKPPGMFKVKAGKDMPGNLTDDQRQALKEQLDEWMGPSQGTKPIIGEGGLEWQQMGLSPVDMDWNNAKVSAARDVGNALGYPPFLYGIPGDNTYANMREARLGLWEETIIPLVWMLAAELTMWLAPRFPGTSDLSIRPNFDDVSALSLKMERTWDRIGGSNWISTNEKREATDYEPKDEPEAEEILIPVTLVPLSISLEPKDLPPPAKEVRGNGLDAEY